MSENCLSLYTQACCKSCEVGETRWTDFKNLQDHSSGKMIVTSNTEMFSNNVRLGVRVLILMLSWFGWH